MAHLIQELPHWSVVLRKKREFLKVAEMDQPISADAED